MNRTEHEGEGFFRLRDAWQCSLPLLAMLSNPGAVCFKFLGTKLLVGVEVLVRGIDWQQIWNTLQCMCMHACIRLVYIASVTIRTVRI